MDVKLFDFNNKVFDVTIKTEELFISGVEVGSSADRCYVPVFRSSPPNPQTEWYFGNLFMKNYYIAFDMSPLDEKDKGYL